MRNGAVVALGCQGFAYPFTFLWDVFFGFYSKEFRNL